MILLGFIYLFFIGIPLGLVFYLYSKAAKLGISFFTALGFSYIVTLLIIPLLYLFSSNFFLDHFFESGLVLLFPLSVIIFVVLFLFKFFKWKPQHIAALIMLEFATTLLYVYMSVLTSNLILKTFHPVPRYFCMYGEVDLVGSCNQDGLASVGDGVFERLNIFNPYLDFNLNPGKLLLIKNPFTKDLEVVRFDKKEYYGNKINVISVDINGQTSTIQIDRQDIKGVD